MRTSMKQAYGQHCPGGIWPRNRDYFTGIRDFTQLRRGNSDLPEEGVIGREFALGWAEVAHE